jgi:hypothetical protein
MSEEKKPQDAYDSPQAEEISTESGPATTAAGLTGDDDSN